MYTIYLITNKVNGKVYVGQTVQPLHRRWGLHKARARRKEGYTTHLYNAIRKHGIDSFEIKEIATCGTSEWSDYLERLYILIYESTNPRIGYNMTTGGERPSPTPEKIEKQRQKLLGRKRSEESKRKTSESLKLAYQEGRHPGTWGHRPSQEQREAWSKRSRGKGHWNFNHKICSEELVFLWNNEVQIKEMADYFGVSVDTVSRRIKSTGLPARPYRPSRIKE